MKLLTISAALLAAVAFAPDSADAQVSRKDYERRDRTTAEAAPPESSRTAPRSSSRARTRDTDDASTGAPPPRRTERGVSRKGDWRGRERTRRPAPRTTNPEPRTPRVYRRGNPGLNVDLFLGALGAEYFGERLTRRERARFQRDLADRARDLRDWAVDLERRDAFLDRRRPQVRRIANRYRLPPNRRLSARELYDWDAELQARAERLDYRERRVSRQERRRGRRWDGPERGYDDRGDYCPPGW